MKNTLSAQDTFCKEGLLFLYPSNTIEGIFVEITLEKNKSIFSNMLLLDEAKDTGKLIPIFQLSLQKKKDFEETFRHAISFQNESKSGPGDTISLTGDQRSISKVLPARLMFAVKHFEGPTENSQFKTNILFQNKKLLSYSKDKPVTWGMLLNLEVVRLPDL